MANELPDTDTYVELPQDRLSGAPPVPRWVKVLGIIVLALVLLMGVVMLTSGVQHGPGMHMPPASVTESGATGGHTSPAQHGG